MILSGVSSVEMSNEGQTTAADSSDVVLEDASNASQTHTHRKTVVSKVVNKTKHS